MGKQNDTFYRSRWDGSTWGLIVLVAACCALPLVFDDDGVMPVVVSTVCFLFVVTVMLSIYYRIEGDKLIVYQFFVPTSYPIDKISEVGPVTTYLSAPATSITHRMVIKFSDRRVLKSTSPLVISPVRQSEFINRLLEINPNIKVSRK